MVENRTSFETIDEGDASIVYLNNAGMARYHPDVKQAGIDAITNQMVYTPGTTVPSIRKSIAKIIDADPKDIALMPSTGFAITFAVKNLAASLLASEGGKILLLQDQFESAVYPWQDVCDRSDRLSFEIVPYPTSDSNWTELVLQRLDGPILVACLPPLHWSDGSLVDLVKISKVCRTKGIPLIVDGTQAVGAFPVSVREIRPTMLACSSHKWLRGPAGTSFVYIDPALHDTWMPLDLHGRGRDLDNDWDASKNTLGPTGYPEKFFKDARKFDRGGKPDPIHTPMLQAALERVAAIDKNELQDELRELLTPLFEWVSKSSKFTIPPNHCYHIVGIRPVDETVTPEKMLEIRNRLAEKQIYIALRCGAFRISPYLDNRKSDIEALVNALEEIEL